MAEAVPRKKVLLSSRALKNSGGLRRDRPALILHHADPLTAYQRLDISFIEQSASTCAELPELVAGISDARISHSARHAISQRQRDCRLQAGRRAKARHAFRFARPQPTREGPPSPVSRVHFAGFGDGKGKRVGRRKARVLASNNCRPRQFYWRQDFNAKSQRNQLFAKRACEFPCVPWRALMRAAP